MGDCVESEERRSAGPASARRSWVVVLVTWTVLAVAVAAGLSGCRRPDPLYDRFPQPVGMRDVVRAERRSAALSEPERIAVEVALDRYQAAFEQLREARIAPFVESVRGVTADDAFADPEGLRRDLARHASILGEIAALDSGLFDDLGRTLGGVDTPFLVALRSRRTLDRANALGMGDGGRALLDYTILVDRLGLAPEVREEIAPLLLAHSAEAAALAERVGREQLILTRRYLDLNERLGPAEQAPGVIAAKNDRDEAINREMVERYSRSRESLERALADYADLIDRTTASLREHMPEDAWSRLDRRVLRARVDDEEGRSADSIAFHALVASRSTEIPAATRARIAELREQFLAEDTELLRQNFAILRAGKVPGQILPGGHDAAQTRKSDRGEIDVKRALLAKKTSEELRQLVPEDVLRRIDGLRDSTREDFKNSITSLVGGGRAPAVIAQRPQGYGERRSAPARPEVERDRDGGALRALVPPAPHPEDFKRLLARAHLDEGSAAIAADLFASLVERWRASADAAQARSNQQIASVVASLERGTATEFRREVQQFLSLADEVRRERQGLEDEFVANLTAAVPNLPPDPVALWSWERRDLHWRIDVGDLPGNEFLTIAPESMVRLFDVLVDADLPDEAWSCIAQVMQGREDEFLQAGERLRSDLLVAVRSMLEIMMDARRRGVDEAQAMRESRSDMLRAAAPVETSSQAVASLNGEAIERICACLADGDARRLRLTYARSAFPRVIDDGRSAGRALDNVREDPALEDGRRAIVDEIVVRRDRARDAVIGELLRWGRESGVSRTNFRRRSELQLRFPPVAKAAFALEESDARALRAAAGLLSAEEAERHQDLARWFDDQMPTVRGYD